MPLPPPNPSSLFSDLCQSDLSFTAIAAKHDTTPDALSLWLAQPEIAATLDALEAAAARRARLSALNQLPHAIKSLSFGLQGHTFDANSDPNTDPDDDQSPAATPRERQHRQSARRAAWLLFRIATFHPGQRRIVAAPHSPSSSAPRGRGVAPGDGEGSPSYSPSFTHESLDPAHTTIAQPPPSAPPSSPAPRGRGVAPGDGEGSASCPAPFARESPEPSPAATAQPSAHADDDLAPSTQPAPPRLILHHHGAPLHSRPRDQRPRSGPAP